MVAGGEGALVSRALELNLHNHRRGAALRWSLFDGTLLLIFLYDLWFQSGCGGVGWWVEGGCAGAVLWALLTHLRTFTTGHTHTINITKEQQRLLGLSDTDLDSSFRIVDASQLSDSLDAGGGSGGGASSAEEDVHNLSLNVSSVCEPPPSPPVPAPRPPASPPPPPPPYRVSVRTPPPSPPSPPAAGPAPSALHEARALAACSLNLRLWIHVTIIERLVREVDAVDAVLAGHEAALGEVSGERAVAAGTAAGAGGAVRAVLPYLEGAGGDARYVVRRLRELGRRGALAGYRGAAGGGPVSDEELLHHWLCTYLRAVTAGGRGDALEPLRRGPTHYEVAGRAVRGRGAALGAWLLAVGAAAHRDPPHWGRTHLGHNGLNLLWVLQDTPPTLPHTLELYH